MTAALVAGAALAAIWILPGFAVLSLASRGRMLEDRRAGIEGWAGFEAAQALVAGSVVVAVVGGTLLAFGWFSASRIGLILVVVGLLGVPALLRWLRLALRPAWRTGALLALAIPAFWSAAQGSLQPSHSYQWYYWELGAKLTAAGGIPAWILEYGERVRWHPDYVFFSAGSEAYRWLTGGIGEASAIVAWRAPVALLGLAMVYAVLRLWVGRVSAMLGVGAVSATTFFLIKFNAYKPESFGIVLGLACVCVLVHGIRRAHVGTVLLACLGFGVAFGIHGIAASVCGALAVGAVAAEWGFARSAGRPWQWRPLLVGAAAIVAVVVATGLSLQGRAVVATDAAHPEVRGGLDQTWTFLERHDANFAITEPPSLGRRILDSINVPWPSRMVRDWAWAPLMAMLLATLVVSLRGPPRLRAAAVAFCVWLVLLFLAATFFAFAFDTFIPQHTGITRIGGYLYLLWAMSIALLATVLAPLARQMVERVRVVARGVRASVGGRSRPALATGGTGLASVGVIAFMLGWAVPVGTDGFSGKLEVAPAGVTALEELRDRSRRRSNAAVLSNASTRGIVEFTTRLEQPIEGRQPVIEDPDFLAAANRVLERVERYFTTLGEPGVDRSKLLRDLHVGWLLVVSRPEILGARDAFGAPGNAIAAARREPGLNLEWSGEDVALLSVEGAPSTLVRNGPAELGGWPIWTALLVVLGVLFAGRASVSVRLHGRQHFQTDHVEAG